jgi:hypothetical protein
MNMFIGTWCCPGTISAGPPGPTAIWNSARARRPQAGQRNALGAVLDHSHRKRRQLFDLMACGLARRHARRLQPVL